jgi:predicted DCC family thiol-disulfide oxidoreductase YuxK/uncharacterized membrane protein YidH (DUF202 family)
MNRTVQGFKALHFWNNYWFREAPLFNLGFCRIVIVGFQLFYLIFRNYLHQITAVIQIPGNNFEPLPVFLFINFPFFGKTIPPDWFLTGVFILTIASGFLALIGLRTKLSLLVFAIGSLYMQAYIYSFGTHHHPEALILIALFLLALSPAGKSLSLDDLKRRVRKNLDLKRFSHHQMLLQSSSLAIWPLLVIQWLFALVYLSAAANKLTPGGTPSFDWLNGYTLQYYLARDGFTWGSSMGVWLSNFHGLAVFLSWLSILFEATFFLVLIFPRLIWFYIPCGALFHIGIYICQRAPFFQYIALYAVFIPWTVVIKSISNRLKWSSDQRKARIFYDGLCPICIRSMTVLCYFDWFQRLDFSDLEISWHELSAIRPDISYEDCLAEMHLLKPDGSVSKGFLAFRDIIQYLPILWPLLPLFYLPGATAIGTQIYKIIASSRQRLDRCTFDSCSIKPPSK